MKAIVAMLAAAVLMAGCLEPEAEVTKPKDAQTLIDSLTFVKHKGNGLCFGVATTSRMSTNATVAMSVMLTQVDCSKVGL